MWPTIVIILAIVILGFIVFVAMQPSDFKITRSATMAASAAKIFPHINDFHKWDNWSPWAKLDPAMKQSYEGPPSGTGAIYSWNGNKQAGEGRMTLKESRPNERIFIKLEFLRPFSATNDAEFLLTPDGSKTLVTWNLTGQKNFFFKAMGLFMNMDKMVGGDFEKGLAQLKTIVENEK